MKLMVCRSAAAWFFPDHRQKIFRTLPITGKKYFVLYLRWLGEGNFLVQILCGGSVIGQPAEQVGQQGPITIRHVDYVDARHDLEQFSGYVDGGPNAGRREIDPAGIRLGVGNEFWDRFGRNTWIDFH